MASIETEHLTLSEPAPDDVPELFEICSDPRVWEHSPEHRHSDPSATQAMVQDWSAEWREHGFGAWVIRPKGEDRVIGYGGCTPLGDVAGNLGIRLSPDYHSQGYGAEVISTAIALAGAVRPGLPLVGYFVESNRGSAGIARKMGFELVHIGPDVTRPGTADTALLFADRTLSQKQIASILRRLNAPFRARRLQG